MSEDKAPRVADPTKQKIIIEAAGTFGVEPELVYPVITSTVLKPAKATDPMPTLPECIAFLIVCMHYKLNPFLKEIHGFAKGGKVTPIVGIDGWITLINGQPLMNGIETEMHFANVDDRKPHSCTCRIYIKDRDRPVEITEYHDECVRPTDQWGKMPCRMLRHKSIIQCARVAFGLSGLYDPDEGHDIIENSGREGVRVRETFDDAEGDPLLGNVGAIPASTDSTPIELDVPDSVEPEKVEAKQDAQEPFDINKYEFTEDDFKDSPREN